MPRGSLAPKAPAGLSATATPPTRLPTASSSTLVVAPAPRLAATAAATPNNPHIANSVPSMAMAAPADTPHITRQIPSQLSLSTIHQRRYDAWYISAHAPAY